MLKMCAYTSSTCALPHWIFVLHYCAQCKRIYIPSTYSDQKNSNVIPNISFHMYPHVACCTVNDRLPFNKKKKCQLCEDSTDSIITEKLYK